MAQYPGSANSDSNLYIAKNNLATTLNGAINNSVTTITVTSTTGFPAVGFITIDTEAISYTSVSPTQFLGCTRGADGTSATSHTDTTQVFHDVVAAHHNVLKDEVIAVSNDVRDTLASITPVTAANTASSFLQRVAHIVSQIKVAFELTNWYDTPPALPTRIDNRSTNLLINGGLEFWQRNTTFTNPTHQSYTADRWKILAPGSGSFTVSQESATANVDTVGANNIGLYSCKIDVTSVGTLTEMRIQQTLENNSYLGTKTITASCRVKTTQAGKINLVLVGPAQSASSSYHTGGGGWETLTATLTTTNSGGAPFVAVGFNDFAPTVSTIYIDSVMLTYGAGSAPFIPTEYGVELRQCQRFYEKSYRVETVPGTSEGTYLESMSGGQTGTTRIYTHMIPFKVEKRTQPTMTFWSSNGTSNKVDWTSVTGAVTNRTAELGFTTRRGFGMVNTAALEYWAIFAWVADAEI